MHNHHGINETTYFGKLPFSAYPTFTALWNYINKPAKNYSELISADIVRTIRLCLKDCCDGSLGAIPNGHTNIKKNRLLCFSLGDLMEGPKERTQAVLFNITAFIWNIIRRQAGYCLTLTSCTSSLKTLSWLNTCAVL